MNTSAHRSDAVWRRFGHRVAASLKRKSSPNAVQVVRGWALELDSLDASLACEFRLRFPYPIPIGLRGSGLMCVPRCNLHLSLIHI